MTIIIKGQASLTASSLYKMRNIVKSELSTVCMQKLGEKDKSFAQVQIMTIFSFEVATITE